MKIKLIDVDGKIDQTDSFVTREPKKGEHLCSHDIPDILMVDVYQFAKTANTNVLEEPDFVAMVKYNVGKSASEMTEQEVAGWFNNPESGLLGGINEKL